MAGLITHLQSATHQLNGSTSGSRPAVIWGTGVTEPCVSLHPAGEPKLFHTVVGQGSKRTRERVQGLLRLGLRTGTGILPHSFGRSKSPDRPRFKGVREAATVYGCGACAERSGELWPLSQSTTVGTSITAVLYVRKLRPEGGKKVLSKLCS